MDPSSYTKCELGDFYTSANATAEQRLLEINYGLKIPNRLIFMKRAYNNKYNLSLLTAKQ